MIVAKEKAEASDRLKSHFINNISHEIRTPLNGILGFGQILTDPDLAEEEKSAYSEMLNKSSIRLIDTVTNFMDIALLTSGNQKVFKNEISPEKQMKAVFAKFKDPCAEKNLLLSLEMPSDSDQTKVFTDNELFYKTLCLFVDNAVKFTHQGSITIGYKKSENDLHFFVKDTGIGISPENKMKIFDNFIQEDGETTRRYEGSGLGLAIAKKFVELLDGKIWLDSEKGIGSIFYFSLPIFKKAPENNFPILGQENYIRRKQTILIAEDDEINLYYFQVLLIHDFIEILHANNGIEAVDICKSHPEIDLVLMDLKMVEMDGFEATRLIKSFRNNLPVIAITAYSESEDKQKALKAGCNDFITKPVKKEFLIKKLEEFGLYCNR